MANGSDQSRTTTAGEVLGRSKKPASSRRSSGLSGLAGQVGNDELLERLSQGNGTRDELLEFLGQRLEAMHSAQEVEVELTKRSDNTFRTMLGESERMGDGPRPKRWIEAARLYEAAARALCTGQLHRGSDLMEKAVKADKQAFDDVKPLVEWDSRLGETGFESFEGSMPAEVGADVACTDCPLPDSLRLAHEIQEHTSSGHDEIKGERRELDPWWLYEEEEEEEEEASG